MWGESGDLRGGRRFCCGFLPDFSDDMLVVSLGQGPCSWSLGPQLASESGCTDCAASSSARDGEKTAAGVGGGKEGEPGGGGA